MATPSRCGATSGASSRRDNYVPALGGHDHHLHGDGGGPAAVLHESLDPKYCILADTTQPPSRAHWFGTDILGCDYYTRVVYGTRTSFEVGILVSAGIVVLSLTLGGAAGFFGGTTDMVISRIADVFFCVPTMLGSILLLTLFGGGGAVAVALVIIFFGWPDMTRLVRSTVISGKHRGYVRAAETMGSPGRRTLRRHVLPNGIAPVLVFAAYVVGGAVASEAALTFLGVGLRLPAISWGLADLDRPDPSHDRRVPAVLPVAVPVPVHRRVRAARRVGARRPGREAGAECLRPLLAVDDLQVEFRTDEGVVKAVDGVTYRLEKGEVLAVLGESGSGKTVHARAILRILDSPPAHITGGTARLRDIDLLTLDEADMREVRGAKIAMLFQDPHTALDPVYTVGEQLIELLRERQKISRREAREVSVALLERVGIADAARSD